MSNWRQYLHQWPIYFTTSLIWLRNDYSRLFWGGIVVRYCPERHILDRKHAFWRIDLTDRSRNATWARAEESKKERKKEKKLKRCDKSHICPDHPRCATPTEVVMWGGVPDIVIHAKFRQNRFRGFGSLRGQNLPFSYAWKPNRKFCAQIFGQL